MLSVLSVCALLASLVAAAVLASGRDDSGPERNALHEWAEGRHSGEPPASITLPEVTCRNEPDDLEALRDCFRAAERRGESATGHLTAEASYPDALDWWATVHPDGTGGYIHRVVTVEPAPDVVSGTIGPRGLRTILTAWTTETCPSVVITAEPGYPGFRCAVEPVSGEWTESRRSTTDAERADLIRRFACTYESIRRHHRC